MQKFGITVLDLHTLYAHDIHITIVVLGLSIAWQLFNKARVNAIQ